MIYTSKSISEIFDDISTLTKIDGFSVTTCLVSSNGMPFSYWTSAGWYNEDEVVYEDPA